MMPETLRGSNLQSSEPTFKNEDCNQIDVPWTEVLVEVCTFGSGSGKKH